MKNSFGYPEKVLITGSTGFVGSQLSKYFSDVGLSVVNLPSNHRERNEGLYESQRLANALEGVNIIIHCAGVAHVSSKNSSSTNNEYERGNVKMTDQLLRAGSDSGAALFVYLSSISVYGDHNGEQSLDENTPCRPTSLYGLSKYRAEQNVIQSCSKGKLSYVILRPVLIYGAGAPGNLRTLMKLLGSNLPIPIGNLKRKRTFLGISNLKNCLRKIVDTPQAWNQIYNICDGSSLDFLSFIKHLARLLGSKSIFPSLPMGFLRLASVLTFSKYFYDVLDRDLVVRSTRIQKLLDWEPREFCCEDFIAMADGYRNEKNIGSSSSS